jgi:hypothetical protein
MTRFAPAVRAHDGQYAAVLPVIRTMAAALIKQDEPLISQKCIHLCKSDVTRRVAHPFDELLALGHDELPASTMATPDRGQSLAKNQRFRYRNVRMIASRIRV